MQAGLQQAMSVIFREPIVTVRAGWTDAGMHARRMFTHFDFHAEIDTEQLTYKLSHLPSRDISVLNIFSLNKDMYARFGTKWRTYHYCVHLSENPFLRHYSCQLPYRLDFSLMNEAVSYLLRIEDFGVFRKSSTDAETTLCHVVQAEWVEVGEDAWYFIIKADHFLRNMVCVVADTLIEAGQYHMTLDESDVVVRSGNHTKTGENMPANALFLEDVEY